MRDRLFSYKFPFHYGWVLVGLLFVALINFGLRGALGAYFISWENEFLISRTAAAAIPLLGWITFAVAQPLAGKLADQYGGRIIFALGSLLIGASLMVSSAVTGFWQLIILLGVFFPSGSAGCSSVVAASLVTHWFAKKRGFVLGIIASGQAVGTLILVPATIFLVEAHGWRYAVLLLGQIVTFGLTPLLALFIRSKPADINLAPYGDGETPAGAGVQKEKVPISLGVIFRNRVFWLLSISYFICGFTDIGFTGTHFIPFAEGRGFTPYTIALVFTLLSASSLLGTVGAGYLADQIDRGKLLRLLYGFRSLTFILLLYARSPVLLFIFALSFGITEMATIAPTGSLCTQMFTKESVGIVFGLVTVCHHLGAAASSYLGGVTYDYWGRYEFILILIMALLVVNAIIVSQIKDNGNVPGSRDRVT